jgi:sulfite reductase (NADPH) flavoprotein alpha-component
VDYREDARNWIDAVLEILQQQKGTVSDASVTASDSVTPAVVYGRQNPFKAKVLDKIKLSGRGSGKEVYHLELLLRNSGLTYEPGDTVGIFCDNPPELVEKVLEITGFDGNELVTVKNGTHPLETALRHHLELSVLNRSVLESYRERTGNEILGDLLNDEQALDIYLYGHDVVDLLTDFPAELDVTGLISVLTPLQPRMYSIASSQAAHPEELHVTVAAVRYDNHDRHRLGAYFFVYNVVSPEHPLRSELYSRAEKLQGIGFPGFPVGENVKFKTVSSQKLIDTGFRFTYRNPLAALGDLYEQEKND